MNQIKNETFLKTSVLKH